MGGLVVPTQRSSHSQKTPIQQATTVSNEPQSNLSVCPVNVEAPLIQALIHRIGPARYGLWFRGQARFRCENDCIIVATRNLQVREWLEHTFGLAVREAAKEVCGTPLPIQWTVDPAALYEEEGKGNTTRPLVIPAPSANTPEHPATEATLSSLSPGMAQIRADQERCPSIPPSPHRLAGTEISPRYDRLCGDEGKKACTTSHATPSHAERKYVEYGEHPLLNGRESVTGLSPTPSACGGTNLFGEPIAPSPSRRGGNRKDVDASAIPTRGPRRWKRLEDFVVGACNRVAYAAALSVVEAPDEAVTPLVFHGPVGVGKTHLLEGIYSGLKRNAQQRPCYVTAEEFTTRFVSAAHHGRMSTFRRQFREVSALLFDDLHFLASRKATQIEFLHTLDSLVAEGRPVVVTLDCHPRLADDLMPELADRLLGGAIWGLLPPDADTRLAILRHKSAGAQPPIPDVVLRTLASCLRGNVRELEGAVHSLRHYARVTGRAVDLILAREALGELIRHAVRVVTLAEVDTAVCTVLRLSPGTLQARSRAWAVTHPRMIAVYLCRKHTSATYGEIARYFGAKTHSTAVAAEKKVRQWLDRDASLSVGSQVWNVRDLIDRIERHLQQ